MWARLKDPRRLLEVTTYGLVAVAVLAAGTGCGREGTSGAPSVPAIPPPSTTSTASAAETAGAPRAEPVTVELVGWTQHTAQDDAALQHRRRAWTEPAGACHVELERWWGMPPSDGGPMQVVGRETVTVDGRNQDLLTTSMFQGTEQVVRVMFFSGPGYNARLVFRQCGAETIRLVLDRVHLATS